MTTLTAFRVTYTDGSTHDTNMAAGITLAQATAYFMQDGGRWVEKVEEIKG